METHYLPRSREPSVIAGRAEALLHRYPNLSETELAATDAYEADGYARVEVTLESGARAFVYVGPKLSA